MTQWILFGTEGCHLCEEAAALLHAARISHPELSFATVDIAEQPALLDRYGSRIPVLHDPATCAELDWPFCGSDIERLARGPSTPEGQT